MSILLQENISFDEFTGTINRTVSQKSEEPKEIISHEEAATAAAYIRDMAINEPGDALIYCAALNLLNTYVKQKDAQIGYKFKTKLGYYLDIIIAVNIENVRIDIQMEKRASLILTQIGKIQFSFHNVKVNSRRLKKSNAYQPKLEWDGIRKQQCASTVFQMAIQNEIKTSNKTYRGKNLREKVEKTVSNYKKGITSIDDILYK